LVLWREHFSLRKERSNDEQEEDGKEGWDVVMPKVGKKTFPYTAKGKVAAQFEAKKTGKKMSKAKGY
jgi:hypothetical protein